MISLYKSLKRVGSSGLSFAEPLKGTVNKNPAFHSTFLRSGLLVSLHWVQLQEYAVLARGGVRAIEGAVTKRVGFDFRGHAF